MGWNQLCIWLGIQEYGREFDNHQRNIAAFVFGTFLLIFCEVGGSGETGLSGFVSEGFRKKIVPTQNCNSIKFVDCVESQFPETEYFRLF